MGFPSGSDSKETACNAGDLGSVPELGSFPREGIGYSFHYSCQEPFLATHSIILAWTEEPGRLQPMGSQRVRHDSTTNT